MARLEFLRFPIRRVSRSDSVSSHQSTVSARHNKTTPVSLSQAAEAAAKCFRVRFEPTPGIRETLGRSDYTEEEARNSWHNRQDLDAIKAQRRVTTRQMEKWNPTVDDGRHYFRGLESKTREGCKRKASNVSKACKVVLEEQRRQKDKGVVDVLKLADSYAKTGAQCVEEAIAIGKHDEGKAISA
eukprot:Nitzschia sp. Nitz4//scaffold137_size62074//45168//45722//NITZ4_006424-RA/size62074-processed-gene-0.71-mRNA-1//1//CDS//3329535727//2542//frame0